MACLSSKAIRLTAENLVDNSQGDDLKFQICVVTLTTLFSRPLHLKYIFILLNFSVLKYKSHFLASNTCNIDISSIGNIWFAVL